MCYFYIRNYGVRPTNYSKITIIERKMRLHMNDVSKNAE